jgi:uncharacterized protein YkwD
MKALLIITSILISTLGLSQIPENKLDNTSEYILKLINEIRIEHGLDTLITDTALIKASEHHVKYMAVYYPTFKNAYSHSEVKRDSSHLIKTIPDFVDRAWDYGANLVSKGISENAVVRNIKPITWEREQLTTCTGAKPKPEDIKKAWEARNKLYSSLTSDTIDYKAAAKYIVYEWMKSEGHRRALLRSNGVEFGAYQSVHIGSDGKPYVMGVYMVTESIK